MREEAVFNSGALAQSTFFVRGGAFIYWTASFITHLLATGCTAPETHVQKFKKSPRQVIPRTAKSLSGYFKCDPGRLLSEAVLWARWKHNGDFVSMTLATTLQLTYDSF